MRRWIRRPFYIPDVLIETDCEDLVSNLALVYGQYCTDREGDTPCLSVTVKKNAKDGYEIRGKGAGVRSVDPLQDLENIIYDGTTIREGIFGLHAGAVRIGQKAVVFVAPTSNGKTTLTTYFVRKGYDYITDDCVLIDMEQMVIHPFPKPIHLREGGIRALDMAGVRPDTTLLDTGMLRRYIYTPPCPLQQDIGIGRILFLDRNETENEVTALKPAIAMQEILRSPITATRMDQRYIRFVHRLARYPCVVVVYKDMEFVHRYLEEDDG
jgi:hypothetical protein